MYLTYCFTQYTIDLKYKLRGPQYAADYQT